MAISSDSNEAFQTMARLGLGHLSLDAQDAVFKAAMTHQYHAFLANDLEYDLDAGESDIPDAALEALAERLKAEIAFAKKDPGSGFNEKIQAELVKTSGTPGMEAARRKALAYHEGERDAAWAALVALVGDEEKASRLVEDFVEEEARVWIYQFSGVIRLGLPPGEEPPSIHAWFVDETH